MTPPGSDTIQQQTAVNLYTRPHRMLSVDTERPMQSWVKMEGVKSRNGSNKEADDDYREAVMVFDEWTVYRDLAAP
ncbi:unnamed protein product [Pieris macdunnoughi]|uniref:Uncharacterized protein n=1 Tax=Pieris macdunnoughi TaxID=345717 RepID=A0A821Q5L7_9NEOP|nr:unnamed protein product [Pieris macdunnoughi]